MVLGRGDCFSLVFFHSNWLRLSLLEMVIILPDGVSKFILLRKMFDGGTCGGLDDFKTGWNVILHF